MKIHLTTATLAAFLATASLSFAASASENWDNLCTKCHAADGSGSTKIGKKMKLKDYTDAKSLASFSDEQLAKAIADGVSKDGKELMRGFKEELKPDDVKAQVELIRKMAKK
jgi:cytochrome c5